VVIGEIKRLWQGIAEGMDMVNSIEQPRARSQASHQVINTLKPAAKDLKLIIVVNYIPAGLALKGYAGKRSPPGTKTPSLPYPR